jgi:molybdenum cofactor cytidylyltransferase
LGDQPQIEISVVEDIIKLYRQTRSYLVIPSYKRRRGHPWLIDHHLFPKITELNEDETLRDFLDQHQDEIRYLQVNEESVLQDLDTLADYQKFQKNLKMD